MSRACLLFVLTIVVTGGGIAQQSRPEQGRGTQTERPALTRDLTAQVNASRRQPDPVNQRWVSSQPGVKIAVREEGVYRVTRSELENAGFPVDSDPANWRLFRDGNEQAILVGDGGEYIDFYGRGIDTFESDTAIYYLLADTAAGLRMQPKIMRTIGGNVLATNYRYQIRAVAHTTYVPSFLNGDADNYFGLLVTTDPVGRMLITLNGIDPAGPDPIIHLDLLGFVGSRHDTRVLINGHDAGVLTGFGRALYGGTFTVPINWLREGSNTIELTALSSSDASIFNATTVDYSRLYFASQDRIPFFSIGYRRVSVTNFTSPDIRVFDTTYDGAPRLVADPVIEQQGHTYTVSLPADRPAVYYAVNDTALLHSPSVAPNEPSSLSSPNNSADMIVVTHSSPEFMTAAESWAEYRRSETGGSFNVKVVDIADVYDEFSYGSHTGAALKSFLTYARQSWQTPLPAYVMLLGDASYDHRNYQGYGYWDLVPTYNHIFAYEEAGVDDELADVDNDGVADMAIGRVPARTAAEIMTALSKTIDFETPANRDLGRGAVFAYSPDYGFTFSSESRSFRSHLPRTVPAQFISGESPTAHDDLISAINAGPYVVNFSGHSTAGIWNNPQILTLNDVALLTNAHSPSLFISLTNYVGFFTRPQAVCLSESLLFAPNGGAAAVLAGVSVTELNSRGALGNALYGELGQGTLTRLGDIVVRAKQVEAGTDGGYAFALIGDPALKVR